MEPRAHHILIGVFTLVIATGAILFALWLAKTGSDNQTKDYTVVFTEAVRGLSRGGAVQYNGIRIGEVTKLELDPEDIRRVLVGITIQGNIPVKTDTKARLALTGITGTSVIELTGGSPNSPDLVDEDLTDDYPAFIMATPSPIAELMAGGEELITNVSELLINANAFLSSDNAKRIGSSIEQLERLLEQLADGSEGLPELFASLNRASVEAEKMLSETRTLITKDGSGAFAKASEAMQSLNKTTQELQKIVEDNAPAIQQGAQGFSQLAPAMQELRQTLSHIKNITQELQNNPSDYLLGGDKLQEFQP